MFNGFQFNEIAFNAPNFYPEYPSGGAVVSGRARSDFWKIRPDIALCLKNDNIIKDAEAAKVRKPSIMGRFAPTTPTTTPAYHYPIYQGWCNVGNPCPGSGVVANITVRNQGRYLPPKAKYILTNSPSQIARMS